ncbi:unnamed protein product [Caenorhabditis sp. 36 PRJEB53466]|nr:unnamed protein product [Caenorhabditis sp. 36 PRJEB53466]
MSSSTKGAGSPTDRPAPRKWFFTKEEMRNTASIKEGMSRDEEMSYRQLAAAFIQEMIDGLNNMKDPKMKIPKELIIGHTGLCIAHTHMHRFYYFHSFKKFDYRDVGAACVFLAGKSHECPRKLSHVISVWRDRKERKQLTTEAARMEAQQIIVLLESMILQTIAFDLNVYLPHTKVLEIMKTVDRDNKHKHLASCAYYFATDVIAVTDWSLRYSAASMAIVIIHLMSAYADVQVDKMFAHHMTPGTFWYTRFDPTMTEEQLREMELDFLSTYRATCKFHHASRYNFRDNRPPQLENPDVVANNRNRDRTRDARSNSPMVAPNHPLIPDSTNGRPRGYVPKDELTVERLNKERQFEEERRKRDHDRMSGRIDNSSSRSSEKRARIDPLSSNFVSSSSSNPHSNGKVAVPPPPMPPPAYPQKNAINRRPLDNPNPSSSHSSPAFRPSSTRAFDVAPMLTPPIPPRAASTENSDMDLEDGELE